MKRIALAVLLLTITVVPRLFAEVNPPKSRADEPVRIKSDTLFTDNNRKMATFSGNVVARQGDVTIYADKLVVSYSEESSEISTAEVFGNVRIIQGNRRAQADHGIYDARKGRITLDGNPRVYQEDNVVSGTTITYFLDEGRSEVSSGAGGRVEAVIHPRGKAPDVRPAKP